MNLSERIVRQLLKDVEGSVIDFDDEESVELLTNRWIEVVSREVHALLDAVLVPILEEEDEDEELNEGIESIG